MRCAALAAIVILAATAACENVAGPGESEFPTLPPLSDAVLPDSIRTAYRDDAIRLALRYVEAVSAAPVTPVEPPTQMVRTLLDGLAHVYRFQHPARDTVVDVLRIHTFPNPQLYELIVGVDTSYAWVKQWRAGNRLTGQPGIDALLEQYRLDVRQYYPWLSGHAVVLRAAEPLNMNALARRFAGIAGVRYAEPNGFMGDGNDIRASVQGSAWRLDYSLGTGDCPAGCTSRITWSFLVDRSGAVTYLGRSGS